jgi:acyl-CoA reductase-like NAD-dependent aldehyde dehydrogenase
MSDIIDVFTTAGTNKGLYYGGAFRAAQTDAVINVTNPATAAHFTTVPDGSSEDVDAAVAAAQSAFGDWSALDPIDRARHLRRFADVIRENIPKLAILETIVTGRALKEMKAQMGRIPEWIEYFAGIAMGLEGESNVVKGGYVTMTQYSSLGPVALLTPWNHPILILVKKMGAALAAGNTL